MANHPSPVIFLRGISNQDLNHVLDFIYHGSVNVSQDNLEAFLKVAEDLKIKGLTQNEGSKSEPTTSSSGSSNPSSQQHSLKRPPQSGQSSQSTPAPVRKRPKMPTPGPSTPNPSIQIKSDGGGAEDDDEIQEVSQHHQQGAADVKSENQSGTGEEILVEGGFEEEGEYGADYEGYDESGEMGYAAEGVPAGEGTSKGRH